MATIDGEKTGGKKLGAKNLVTTEIKNKILSVVHSYVTEEGVRKLETDLATLRPVDRVTLIEKLMKYVLPTLGSMKLEGNDDGDPIKIMVEYVDETKSIVDDDDTDIDYSVK